MIPNYYIGNVFDRTSILNWLFRVPDESFFKETRWVNSIDVDFFGEDVYRGYLLFYYRKKWV